MTSRPVLPAIPGLCVGCQKPTNEMPLCVQCCAVWANDGDCWDDTSEPARQIRAAAGAWQDTQHRQRVEARRASAPGR